jgi:hypothetical protein
MRRLVFATVAILAISIVSFSRADTLSTGTYSTGDGTDGNQTTPAGPTGPWTLTATDSSFSYLLRSVDQTFSFSQLTNLNAVFQTNPNGTPADTGAGGGSPRLRVQLDDTVDGRGIGSISIYLGDPSSYTANLDGYSGRNVIGSPDNGRYDTSAFSGGSPSTTYASALAMLGNATVLRLGIVEDTFGTIGDKNITVDSLNASFVPLPSAVWGGAGLLCLLGLMKLKGRKTISA